MNSRSVDLPDSLGPQTTISSCSASASTCQPARPPKPSMRQPSTLIGPAPRASRRRSRRRARRAVPAGRRRGRRDRRARRPGRTARSRPARCSSKRAWRIRSSAAPSTCGWPSCSPTSTGGVTPSSRTSTSRICRRSRSASGEVVGRLGAAQLGVERRAALQADAQHPVLARQHAALAGEVVEPPLAVLDQAARVVDLAQVVEHQLLPAHGRERAELDARAVGAELDVEGALRARLAEVPALQAARVPGRAARSRRRSRCARGRAPSSRSRGPARSAVVHGA